MAEEGEGNNHDGVIEDPKISNSADYPPASSAVGSIPCFSISIWPPTQRTRDAVVKRLIDNLSTSSILSKRYGNLTHEQSSIVARLVEQEAFDVASASSSTAASAEMRETNKESIEEGIEILQIYSKEISRRMLESVKATASSASAAVTAKNFTAGPIDSGHSTPQS
ncbi:hypothetical protein HPP92_023698 [Vanilla planifolia]|uniref:WPP domain-containing protein n=1 Tax=Vanilla planifolia TaxID=51239 RepID=A0A835PQT4_VANPL|nr:hypothetical protein HPP92_023698 [Vanilla planifolia]